LKGKRRRSDPPEKHSIHSFLPVVSTKRKSIPHQASSSSTMDPFGQHQHQQQQQDVLRRKQSVYAQIEYYRKLEQSMGEAAIGGGGGGMQQQQPQPLIEQHDYEEHQQQQQHFPPIQSVLQQQQQHHQQMELLYDAGEGTSTGRYSRMAVARKLGREFGDGGKCGF
jgi:hypothetical protein